jgi:hypothetical protein
MNDLTRALLADASHAAREQLEQILEERMAALTAGVEAAVAETLVGSPVALFREYGAVEQYAG